jgi:hypothetical protein
MTRAIQLASRSLFAAGVAAALGFGALQAAPAEALAAPPPCTDQYCNDYCTGRGYAYGFCNISTMRCVCR